MIGALLFTLLILTVLSIGWMWYIICQKNREINLLQHSITTTHSDREVLLGEIHHRVRNNLQVVTGLLNWQASFIKDHRALGAINDGHNRVQSMAILHQKLYQEEHLTGIEVNDYVQRLCQHLLHEFKVPAGQLQLDIDIPEIWVDIETLIPLGLILNELISLSLKTWTKEDQNSWLSVSLLEEEGRGLKLCVADSWTAFERKMEEQWKRSFSWALVDTLAQKLKTTIEIERHTGICIRLHLKRYKIARSSGK